MPHADVPKFFMDGWGRTPWSRLGVRVGRLREASQWKEKPAGAR